MTQHLPSRPCIRRPKILLTAACLCAKGYKRETMLPSLLGASPEQVVDILSEREAGLEIERRARLGTYSAQTHIEVLSALLSEMKKAA